MRPVGFKDQAPEWIKPPKRNPPGASPPSTTRAGSRMSSSTWCARSTSGRRGGRRHRLAHHARCRQGPFQTAVAAPSRRSRPEHCNVASPSSTRAEERLQRTPPAGGLRVPPAQVSKYLHRSGKAASAVLADVNLAAAAGRRGQARRRADFRPCWLLDPGMLGLPRQAAGVGERKILRSIAHGIKVMSDRLLVKEERWAPVVWRGPKPQGA